MASMNESDLILKRDVGGSVLVPVRRQMERAQGFERSGVCAPKFAGIAGVSYQAILVWQAKTGDSVCGGVCARGECGGWLRDGRTMAEREGLCGGKGFPLHGSRVSGSCLNG